MIGTEPLPPSVTRRAARGLRGNILAFLVLLLASGLLGACSPSMATLNGEPDRYYGKVIPLDGTIGDILLRSPEGNPILFHLVSSGGKRVVVFAPESARFHYGDAVRVTGEFERERTVGGRKLYDVLHANSVSRTGFLDRLPLF